MSVGSRPPATPRREREEGGPVCCLASASSGGDNRDAQKQEQEKAAQQGRGHAAATGPHAAIVLSEWLGLAGDDPTSAGLLALLIRAGAAPPRHVALLAAALREANSDSDSDSLHLQALQGLGALSPRLVRPHLPLVAATIARLLRARPAATRATALGTLHGLLRQQQQQQQQQQQLACRGPDTDAEAAAAAVPLLALHPAVAALAARDAASPAVRIRALECLGRLPLRLAALHLGGALLPRLADARPGVQAATLAALEALHARGDNGEDGARRFSEALSRHARCLVGLFVRGGAAATAATTRGRRRRGAAAVFVVEEKGASRTGSRVCRTRLAVLRVLSSFVPPAALLAHVGELAAAVGWGPQPEQGKEEEEENSQPTTRRSLRAALAPMPLGSPASSPSRGRSFNPRTRSCPGSPASSSSPATAMAMAAAGGLRPRPRRLVFEEDEDEEEQAQVQEKHAADTSSSDDDDDDDDDDDNNQQQDEAVQAGLLAVLGTLPTAPVLPHLAPIARRFLLPRLLAPDAEAGGAAAAVRACLNSIRNPEVRRQCLSHLFEPLLDHDAVATAAATSRRRRRLLCLLLSDGAWGAKALFPLLPAETSALAACLTDPCADVRRDACVLLLQSASVPYAHHHHHHHHHGGLKGLRDVAVSMGAAGVERDKENARLLVGREHHTAPR